MTLKQKVTIVLTVMMCMNSVSGFSTVICHGSDGHIAVEPVIHNHCECSESDEASYQDKLAGYVIDSCSDHGHCTDTIATSSYILSTRKNLKLSAYKVSTATLFQKSIPTYPTSSFGHLTARGHELSSFYAPLRTIIILA